MFKNAGFKPLFLLILSAIIVVSFVVLKVRDFRSPEKDLDVVDTLDFRVVSDSVFRENNSGLINGFSSYNEFASFVNDNKVDGLPLSSLAVDYGNVFAQGQEYLYAITGEGLSVINMDAFDDPELVSRLEFEGRLISVHFSADVLLLFQELDNRVFLRFFEASDPYNLVEFKKFEMDGSYFSSRLIDGYVYFVVNNYNNAFPGVFYQTEELHFDCRDGLNCLYPDIYYFDTDYNDGFNFSSVVSISISERLDDIRFSSYLIPRPDHILLSLDDIYISYTKRFNEKLLESQILLELIYPRLSDEDRSVIDEIYNISDQILGIEDKRLKIRQKLDRYIGFLSPSDRRSLWLELNSRIKEREPNLKERSSFSVICRLAFFDGIVEPVAEGIVLGDLLSFRSYNEYLKVLAFQDPSFLNYVSDDEKSLNFYILDENIQILDELISLSSSGKDYSLDLNDTASLSLALSSDDALFLIDSENPFNISFSAKWGGLDYDESSHLYVGDYLFFLGLKDSGLELFYWDTSAGSFDNKGFYAFEEAELYSSIFSQESNLFYLDDDNILVLALSLSYDYPKTFTALAFLNVESSGIELDEIVDLGTDNILVFEKDLYYIPDYSFWFSSKGAFFK